MAKNGKTNQARDSALIDLADTEKTAAGLRLLAHLPAAPRTGLNTEDSEIMALQIVNMVDAIFLFLRPDGTVAFINQTGCAALACGEEEAVGQNWFNEFVPADFRNGARNLHIKLITGKLAEIKKFESRIIGKNGQEKIILWHKRALKNSAGVITGVLNSGQDITELKKAAGEKIFDAKIQSVLNKLLHISLNDWSLTKILDQINDHLLSIPWIALESRGGIWLADHNAKSLWLASRRGLSSDFIKCERIIFGQCLCGRAAATGKVVFATDKNSQHEIKHDRLPAHAHYCVPIISKNKVLGIMNFYLKSGHKYDKKEVGFLQAVGSVVANIIERKQAEEEVRRLNELNQKILDNAPVSIAMLDHQGAIVAVNKMEVQLMRQTSAQIVGTKLTDTNEIRGNQKISVLYQLLLAAGRPFYYDNLSYVQSQTGRKKSLNIIAVPLFGKDGRVEGAISMALDNTKAMEAKKKLKNLNQDLERKVGERTRELHDINKRLSTILDLKSKFVADASHELRTPLTVIQGNLDLAIREAKNKQGREVPEIFELIMDEVERMRAVLTDLTMLTNVDIGSEQLNHEMVNLGDLVQAAGQSLSVLAKQKKISLRYKRGAKNVMIMGDDTKLEKLLLNIVRNGIKYTGPGGRVKAWVEKDEHEARIVVEDNGIGIPEDDLPFIFERFYRVDKARSRKEGGSGLGLSIAKWIAEEHNGSITVKSVLGQGSIFTVHLPFDYRKSGVEAKLF